MELNTITQAQSVSLPSKFWGSVTSESLSGCDIELLDCCSLSGSAEAKRTYHDLDFNQVKLWDCQINNRCVASIFPQLGFEFINSCQVMDL
ncbi:uncharacterized protein LOC127244045 isoform X2 [Andrographis paniculata]|uniref:uncharacterized protein LOC127244045 isoform X2 n=1 Tax=Andrographis paniculata TaxID=175694 RepID=UPI0021E96C45|nr:uncharacterized protein LOC127244045 isoform X2 [Andrographis paniculata]